MAASITHSVDPGLDTWETKLTPPGLLDNLTMLLQNSQGANLDIATIDLLSASGIYDAKSFILFTQKPFSALLSTLSDSYFPVYQMTSFAMHNFMAAILSNNDCFALMVLWILRPSTGVTTTSIGIPTAMKLGSLLILPITLRPRPTNRPDWLNSHVMDLLLW